MGHFIITIEYNITLFIGTYTEDSLFLNLFLFIQANIAPNMSGFIDTMLKIMIFKTTGKKAFEDYRIFPHPKLSCKEVGTNLWLILFFLLKVIFFIYKELRSA